jgi:hypothetical protein
MASILSFASSGSLLSIAVPDHPMAFGGERMAGLADDAEDAPIGIIGYRHGNALAGSISHGKHRLRP